MNQYELSHVGVRSKPGRGEYWTGCQMKQGVNYPRRSNLINSTLEN
jgi:hypothetical protein